MRLLITRPAANAAPLAEKLAALGHDVVMSPVIEIYPTETPLPPRAADYAALALTSANGVHALAAKLPANPTEKQAWQALPAYAVGPQTAAALSAYGWQDIGQAAGDVDSLAALIRANIAPAGKPILHVAGRHRAGNLQAALAAQNIACHLSMLYAADAAAALSPAACAALADTEEPIDAVLVYSQRSAQHFIKLGMGIQMSQKPLAFCLSETIGALMGAAGYETRIAAHPNEAAMLALTTQAAS